MLSEKVKASRVKLNNKSFLIAKEKHGDRYFHVPYIKTLDKVCKQLFRERLKEGWYEMNKIDSNTEHIGKIQLHRRKMLLEEELKIDYRVRGAPSCGLMPNERAFIEKICTVSISGGNPSAAQRDCRDYRLVEFLQKEIKEMEDAIAYDKNEREFVLEFKQLLANPKIPINHSGLPMSYSLLRNRSDYEYEEIKLERMN